MTGMVANQVLSMVSLSDMTAWLAEHGLDIHEVCDLTIRVEPSGQNGHPLYLWIDATWYKVNDLGNRYFEMGSREAATGRSSIPLRSFPPLSNR